MKKMLLAYACLFVLPQVRAQTAVTFTINTAAERKPINPLIYGINHTNDFPVYGSPENYGSIRLGGNRLTGYNWEINASNAGEDYFNNSDDFLCDEFGLTTAECNTAGTVFNRFRQRAGNMYTLATLPLAGYVAADKNGPVSATEAAPSPRWKQIQHIKGSAFTLTPNPNDNVVYSDEFMNYLVTTIGSAATTGIKAYNLDNEPGLWNPAAPPQTHPHLHPGPVSAVELATKSRALARAIKSVDPTAETYGGVFYGFSDFYNLQAASDWPALENGYGWYMDYFLEQMRQESNGFGRRLLDVIDLHWYPEAMGDQRIIEMNANSPNDQQARMQAPRTLWDPAYRENSWIGDWFSQYLPLIPRIHTSISQYYPGTKIGISEYNYGGGGNISGGIAQADVLGILGKYDVYSAQYWPIFQQSVDYVRAAFRIFRNYNGAGRTFGNTYVHSRTADSVRTSVYASIDGNDDSVLHLVVINKTNAMVNGNFNLNTAYVSGAAWQLTGASSNNFTTSNLTVGGTSFSYAMPALSVSHLELRKSTVLPVRLNYFKGAVQSGAPLLTWNTSEETGLAHFEIERSADGINFTTIATVPARNITFGSNYQFTDQSVQSLATGKLYYRLRMVEEGESRYSSIVSLQLSALNPGIAAYPNPVKDQLTITGLEINRMQVMITDATGRIVMQRTTAGAPTAYFNVQGLQAGIYQVQLINDSGYRWSLRFTKQ
jgi:mannan endo-1,4-beta-mannosidase